MSKSTPVVLQSKAVVFQWEASDNPNDPEGVATFKCDGCSVKVALHDFATASRLSYLIQSAYQLGKNDALDRALPAIEKLLSKQRYD
jgi:hypothetical protein